MSWSTDYSEGHEGWAASVTPDGRRTGSSTGQGMLVEGITGRYERDTTLPDYEVVPHREIIGWQGQCECGWQGELWERVPSAEEADAGRRKVHLPLEKSAHAPEAVEDAIGDEWLEHVAPFGAVAGVEAAARDYAQAGRRLDKTVAAAKAAGATWADIGRAAGITRQAAHERWADK
ncbi:hypothetical protein ACFVTE_15980 [Arthrobacter sp. NPDC058097]|uniref:hypothetical protein n=1 Tax=Arthrobacter sp. NPDC058097 TaxID=3346340 RepID=UPI0036DB9C05